ncbi:succinyl-CoA synthetase subunit alpha [Candidatus Woesearchaeota archaeon]|nr:succinyl-CoA synthetase subunit alpha [Candidatus Woesearchaeota archaeon]
MEKNYEFFMKTDLSHFIGKWIAICNEKIVSSGNNPKQVFQEARRKCPSERPLLAKVPEKETMIF